MSNSTKDSTAARTIRRFLKPPPTVHLSIGPTKHSAAGVGWAGNVSQTHSLEAQMRQGERTQETMSAVPAPG